MTDVENILALELDSQTQLLTQVQFLTQFNSNLIQLIGQPGSGKSWLCERYLESWAKEPIKSLLICYPEQNETQQKTVIFRQLVKDATINERHTLADSLRVILNGEPIHALIAIDNAHCLSRAFLKEILELVIEAQRNENWQINVLLFSNLGKWDKFLQKLIFRKGIRPISFDIPPLNAIERDFFIDHIFSAQNIPASSQASLKNFWSKIPSLPGALLAIDSQKYGHSLASLNQVDLTSEVQFEKVPDPSSLATNTNETVSLEDKANFENQDTKEAAAPEALLVTKEGAKRPLNLPMPLVLVAGSGILLLVMLGVIFFALKEDAPLTAQPGSITHLSHTSPEQEAANLLLEDKKIAVQDRDTEEKALTLSSDMLVPLSDKNTESEKSEAEKIIAASDIMPDKKSEDSQDITKNNQTPSSDPLDTSPELDNFSLPKDKVLSGTIVEVAKKNNHLAELEVKSTPKNSEEAKPLVKTPVETKPIETKAKTSVPAGGFIVEPITPSEALARDSEKTKTKISQWAKSSSQINQKAPKMGPAPLVPLSNQLLSQIPKHRFTLQLIALKSRDAVNNFVRDYDLENTAFVYETRRLGLPVFIVVHGDYPNQAAAKNAIVGLEQAVQALGPWSKSFEQIHKEIQNLN